MPFFMSDFNTLCYPGDPHNILTSVPEYYEYVKKWDLSFPTVGYELFSLGYFMSIHYGIVVVYMFLLVDRTYTNTERERKKERVLV